MPNGFTITNLPEAAEPSTLAEVTALVTAVGTSLNGVVVPLIFLAALWIFRKAISEVIVNLSSVEGPGGVKVQTHPRLRPATEAVEEMTAEEIAAAGSETVDTRKAEPEAPSDTTVSSERAGEPMADKGAANDQINPTELSPEAYQVTSARYEKMKDLLKRVDLSSPWYIGVEKADVVQDTFTELLRTHPASAVLFVWKNVETELRTLASARGVAPKISRAPTRVLIAKLKRADAMPIALADLLREMMEVRDDAAHFGAQVSEATALDFRRSAEAASREIARQIWRAMQTDQVWVNDDD